MTMSRLKRYGKIVLFDSLAGLCFVGVILFGWLPGPGGIPLFLAGLGLLAVNHDWAERWLETAKHKGKTFKQILFPRVAWIRHTYDIVSVLIFVGSVYIYFRRISTITSVVSVAAGCFALFVFLVNRERLDKLSGLFKKKA